MVSTKVVDQPVDHQPMLGRINAGDARVVPLNTDHWG